MNKPRNLDELFELMKNNEMDCDWDSVPTFGGSEPVDTCELWSWDKTRKVVGTCSDDIEIVERDDV